MGQHQHSRAAAFEAGLLDHPDDLARWSAYSDYLTEQGDPRGEFMAVQLALEDESLSAADRKRLKKAEADLLKLHERDWLGPLAEFTADPARRSAGGRAGEAPRVLHSFERGWLRRVEFPNLTVAQARALAACDAARLLRELVVELIEAESPEGDPDRYIDSYYSPGPDVPPGIDPYEDPGLHALLHCPHLPAVRHFRLGEPAAWKDEYVRCSTSGQLAYQLVQKMPRVEVLELHAQDVDADRVFALPMPHLRELNLLHATHYPLDALAANPTVQNLTALRCHPHALRPEDRRQGAYIRFHHLRAVCRSPHLGRLDTLCLRLTDFGDAGVREVIDSGLLARLTVLDLRGGLVSDAGAELLAASPHLKQLKFLNLGRNALTARGVQAIRATGVNAELVQQHTTLAYDPSRESPDFLYDGDFE